MFQRRSALSVRKIGRALAVAVLFTGVLTALAPTAQATALPYPDTITASVSSDYAAPCTPPACSVPSVIVQQNTDFNLHITLTAGGSPADFSSPTKLALTATGSDGTTDAVGNLSPSSITMPGGTDQADFTVSYSTFVNQIEVWAKLGKTKGKTSTVTSTPSALFDVLQFVDTKGHLEGQSFTVGTSENDCASVDAENPVCGIVTFPSGTLSDVLVSEGACNDINCNTKGLVAQVIASMGALYDATHPATMLIKCYRTVCGQGGVSKVKIFASILASGGLVESPACPAKGVVQSDTPNTPFCTDYVQSTRAGADLSLMVVLFYKDFRGSA
jgi:hypothetical protein